MMKASQWPAYAVVGLVTASLALMAATRVPPAVAAGAPKPPAAEATEPPAAEAAKPPAAEATEPPAAKASSAALEQLLKQSKLDYIPKEGYFLVPVTMDGETTLVSMWQDGIGDDPKLRLACLDTQIIELPSKAKLPLPLLKKMAEINDDLLIGKLGLDSSGIWFSSSFWLNHADADTLMAELVMAHVARTNGRKDLMPFLQE